MPEPVPEPAWLTPLVDQRLALMEAHLGSTADVGVPLVMTPVSEPGEHATPEEFERWDRTCDNCGAYCPDPMPFWTGHVLRMRGEVQVFFMFGACATCRELP
jgi:hypothetical protein